ncbi:MAG TPA: DUF1810 domain-containing protein [Blastocatellia bacterium]|nr:DUF1810 domain-containing protein [Blastocatellia bacterium]
MDPFNLQRFVDAQRDTYSEAYAELKSGRKASHWMWFVFPQLKGLGHSYNANYFGISSLAEAKAYLEHPVLGPRLRECTTAVNAVSGRTAHEIFGSPDDMKFRSSMTLFARATSDDSIFAKALRKYFGGREDERTVELLK